MGANTEIQWTWEFNPDGSVKSKGRTWSPVGGCDKHSPGCDNCYAKRLHTQRHDAKMRGAALPPQYAEPFETIQLFEKRLGEPLTWKDPCKVFVNSMSDTFHKKVPVEFLAEMFATMAMAKDLTFLVLTKRIDRAEIFLNSVDFQGLVGEAMVRRGANVWESVAVINGMLWPLRNVQIGTSVENQRTADLRLPILRRVKAWTRFVSVEPLLERISIKRHLACHHGNHGACAACESNRKHSIHHYPYIAREAGPAIHQVIVGGESGEGSRPMPPEAPAELRDECQECGVAYFFKQWGDWVPGEQVPDEKRYPTRCRSNGKWVDCSDDWATEQDHGPLVYRLGKKKAGRNLEGREWNESPIY